MAKRSREETSKPIYFGMVMTSGCEPIENCSFYFTEYEALTKEQRTKLCGSCPTSRRKAGIPGCEGEEDLKGWKVLENQEEIEEFTENNHVVVTVAYFDE